MEHRHPGPQFLDNHPGTGSKALVPAAASLEKSPAGFFTKQWELRHQSEGLRGSWVDLGGAERILGGSEAGSSLSTPCWEGRRWELGTYKIQAGSEE